MIPVWREMSFDDAVCCNDAREAAEEIVPFLVQCPASLSDILLKLSDFTLRNTGEISTCIQICLLVSHSNLKSILSSEVNVNMLEQIFQRIAFGLARLLHDEASNSDYF